MRDTPTSSGRSPGPGPWLQVWVEAGREGRVFTYAPPGGGPLLAPGDLVRVRLQGRRHAGLVIETRNELPEDLHERTILPVEAVLQRAAVDPDWQALLEEVAEAFHTSLFRTLKTALPTGWLGQGAGRSGAEGGGMVWIVAAHAEGASEPGTAALPRRLGARQRELLERLAGRREGVPLRELVGQEGFSRAVLATAERHGLVRREKRTASMPATGRAAMDPPRPQPAWTATPAQSAAVRAIAAADPGQALLLWGVTGAGKTEVYLQAAAAELAAGRSVLLLTPEIGLIPQLLDRCRARFGSVIEYHSAIGEADRVAAWRGCLEAARRGLPVVAVGTRSAIFLPLGRLGLIVLDEEHDASYKQETPMPCYHARDVARRRARRCGARLVLGSATPSLETWLDCRPEGETRLLRLPERIGRGSLPAVRVVDMRMELAEGNRRLISRALMERLQRLREAGEQAVVLVPRRGYRAFLSCRSCGQVVHCPHCDVALTVHRSGNGREWLRCHWCDHRQEMTDRCGSCGSTAFRPFGAGTQRVIEKLGSELEGLRLLRFDRDTTRGRDGHRRLLDAFAAGEADVLVGTQMLAKGMDLPRVTLAAVLAADGLLHRPDLRAAEHCLQLLLQLAGRAGRGERPGEVLVQTYSPEHPVIRHLVDGRYERFLEEELDLRRRGGLLPFSRACLLRLAGPAASTTATAAATLVEHIRPAAQAAGWCVIGPAPAPVARVAGRSRWQVLLHGPVAARLPLPPEANLREFLPNGVGLTIDPDPLHL